MFVNSLLQILLGINNQSTIFGTSFPLSQHIPVIFTEVSNIVRNLKDKKAPGDDLISNRALKEIFKRNIELVTRIFNKIFELGYFHARWKVAKVNVISKVAKPLHAAVN